MEKLCQLVKMGQVYGLWLGGGIYLINVQSAELDHHDQHGDQHGQSWEEDQQTHKMLKIHD